MALMATRMYEDFLIHSLRFSLSLLKVCSSKLEKFRDLVLVNINFIFPLKKQWLKYLPPKRFKISSYRKFDRTVGKIRDGTAGARVQMIIAECIKIIISC